MEINETLKDTAGKIIKDALDAVGVPTTDTESIAKDILEKAKSVIDLGKCHDFTEPTMNAIIKAATETETAPWYQIGSWSCWGNVKKEIGNLDWDDCANYGDNYYTELAKSNKEFLKNYKAIVNNVYETDSTSATKVTASVLMIPIINAILKGASDSITVIN